MKNRLLYRIIVFIQRHSIATLLFLLLTTALFAYFATKIRIDTQAQNLLPESSSSKKLLEKYSYEPKDEDFLILLVEGTDIFSLAKIEALHKASELIESLEPVRRSITPFNIRGFQSRNRRIAFEPMMPGGGAPQNQAELDAFRERLMSDPLAKNVVISEDGTTFAFIFVTAFLQDYTELMQDVDAIIEPLKSLFTPYLAGYIAFDDATRKNLTRDPPKLVLIGLAVILVIYLISFPSLRVVPLPLITVVTGMIWTIGLMGMLKIPLTIISIMIPPLILALGSSYSIYILNQYFAEIAGQSGGSKDSREVVALAISKIVPTILLASVTTSIGFASLIFASISPIRQFGIFTAVGVLMTSLLTMLLYPAVLTRIPIRAKTPKKMRRPLTAAAEWIGAHMRLFKIAVPVVCIIIIGVFFLFLGNIRYETDFTSYFRNREKAVEDNKFLMEKLGGFVYVYLTVTAPEDTENFWLDPDVLKELSLFEERLEQHPDIVSVSSFTSYAKAVNYAQSGTYELPESRAIMIFLSRIFKALAENSDYAVNRLVDPDINQLTLQIRVYDHETKWFLFENDLAELEDYLKSTAAEMLPAEFEPEPWGWNFALIYISKILRNDQIKSIVVSALFIFALASIYFRSFVFGLLTLVPLATGVMINFAIMGLFGIPFDVVTVMFASIAIGLGVDDSIHLLILYRKAVKDHPDDKNAAVKAALNGAGRPILLTSISIIAGLIVLTLSSFTPIVYLGLIISIALVATTAGALVILTTLLSYGNKA